MVPILFVFVALALLYSTLRVASRIRNWIGADCPRTSLLLPLETPNSAVRARPLAHRGNPRRKNGSRILFCSVFRTNLLKTLEIAVKLIRGSGTPGDPFDFPNSPSEENDSCQKERNNGFTENVGGFTPGTRANRGSDRDAGTFGARPRSARPSAAWMTAIKRRGRPPGSKNKLKETAAA